MHSNLIQVNPIYFNEFMIHSKVIIIIFSIYKNLHIAFTKKISFIINSLIDDLSG